MSEDKVRQLYFQNPKFGFHLVQLITKRLLENCASAEALPGRWPDAEGLREGGGIGTDAAESILAPTGVMMRKWPACARG